MQRIIVIGCPGSGKTTFAKRLCEKTEIPLFHLDAIWHKADRTHISREAFDERLGEILSLDACIIDGHYSRTLEKRIAWADTVFFFDLPVEICLQGALARVGQVREDMPWTDEELDATLREEIAQFAEAQRPKIYELLHQYAEGRTMVIFKRREESAIWLADTPFGANERF